MVNKQLAPELASILEDLQNLPKDQRIQTVPDLNVELYPHQVCRAYF